MTWENTVGQIKFSIIVPVYNVEPYLEKCVESLVNQEKMEEQPEILLIDDGSRDQSGALCDRLAEQFSQIQVFHKENGGLSSARNMGIEKASGEYVLFVDSDDYIEKNTCSILEKAIREYGPSDVLFFDGTEENGDLRTPMKRVQEKRVICTSDGKQYLLNHYKTRNLNVEACLSVYKRSFLAKNKLKFTEGILHEDVEFTPRALLACGKVLELPDCLYHYMVRENSISTHKNREKNIKDLFATLRQQTKMAEQQEPELKKWMNNGILDSYLNMIQDAKMYRPQYRRLLDKHFLLGKAATPWNRIRVLLCLLNVKWYCQINDFYKKLRSGRMKV